MWVVCLDQNKTGKWTLEIQKGALFTISVAAFQNQAYYTRDEII